MAFVDMQLIDGLGLPYVRGAEASLLDDSLDPALDAAWQTLLATFPGLTFAPLFDAQPAERLADLVDAIRVGGDEPADPFVWFTLECDPAIADALAPAVQALPMVVLAFVRQEAFPAATVSYGTNPDTSRTLQIQPSPNGVDAIYAWQVAGGAGEGVRIADIENGWNLGHDELLTASIRKLSVFGARDIDHGTAVAGIVVGADNGLGTIGIVPNARFDLVTADRGGVNNVAAAIMLAAASLSRGDILLLELALPFRPGNAPDVLLEFDFAAQHAISLATQRGITVIEPAGNGTINLDDFAFLAHTRPQSPTFSGAIVVAAAELTGPALDTWTHTGSSFGSRVDCFADGLRVRAPSSAATDAYQLFDGTSSASAIIAGVAASLQAMTRASGQGPLAPADVRRLLRSALLGTLPSNPLGAKIGPMPDLRKIARAQGLMRVLPVGAARIGGDALLIVHLDADNLVVRRHFTLLTGWGQPIPSPSPNDRFELTGAQPAVTASDEDDPITRLVFDAFFSGPSGLHHVFWDSLDQVGDLTTPIAPFNAIAQGRALAAVRPRLDLVAIAGISPEGRVVVLNGDPQILHAAVSPPLVLDAIGSYRRISGPVLASRGVGLADLVAIEDGGTLSWFTGVLPAVAGTGWSPRIGDPSGVAFDPGARPALFVSDALLLAAAVDSDAHLRVATLRPATQTIDIPVLVDAQVTIDTSGPVALGRTLQNIVALGVDTAGTLRAATRPIPGGDWTALQPILAPVAISPLGGVSAVTLDIGVMAIVVGVDGIVHSALSVDGLLWSPLLPLP
jgi:hypothetical protein